MPDGQALKRQAIIIGVLAALFFAADLAVSAVGFYTDWLWFGSLGYQSIFMTVLQAKVVAFLAGMLVFLIPAVASVLVARALLGKKRGGVSIREDNGVAYIVQLDQESPRRLSVLVALLASVVLSLLMGLWASGQWEVLLKFMNAQSFGVADPLFGQDVGFYFFTLPLYGFAQGWVFWSLLVVLVITAAIYTIGFQEGNLTFDPGIFSSNRGAKIHVMVLAAAIALVMALSYRIQIFDLVYASGGVAFGAGYTDANARQMALWALMGIMVIIAALFLVSAFRRGFTLPLWGVGLWVVAAVLLGGVYPAVVQKLFVEPSQLEKERPYIESTIQMTRQAFGLDKVQERDFNAEDAVSLSSINENPGTVNNIRLWDHRPLRDTYNQIQAIRLYYDFHDVDVDRYTIDGQYRQVMLSARELSPEKLASQAQNWVTRRLQFTHGYGFAMSPVNEIVGEGLPSLLVKDLPPQGPIKVDRPQIYYGETSDQYVIVRTSAQEFDYAKGDENVYGSYEAEGGVALNSFIRKLAYAWYFRDGNILFTQYLTPDSRILYDRQIQQRVQKIAPFLMLDNDPYLVVADGQLYWIQDAYTHGSDYPYSAPYQESVQVAQQANQQAVAVPTGRSYNYIRNSVKVVVNAYDGSVQFYLADPTDPLAAAYGSIFPDLFVPISDMPDSLRAHVRYPEGLFQAQAEMYQTFHMMDPQVFYNREDLWSIPTELFSDNRQQVEPYFVIMKLPDAQKEEFLLMLPFAPSNKDNMIAWLAARSDGDNYGKLTVYKYPKDKLIYGPMQVEARINQDPAISSQFTLWSQRGSSVIRGNLLVIPVGGANLYVEPVYLQSDSGSIPELKRVIVSTGNKVAMEPSLAESLNKLYDGKIAMGPAGQVGQATQPAQPAGQQPAQAGQPSVPGAPVSPEMADLARSAQDHYNKAQELLRAGDLAGFGDELKKLEADLNALNQQAQQGQ